MADDATNPVAAQDTPAPATEVADPTPEIEPDETDGQEAPAVEEEEIDWEDGQRYRVPKPIKAGLLRQADYTRKTQEVAETRRALETREKEFTQEREAHQNYLQDYARIAALDEQLKPFAEFKPEQWTAWLQQDPIPANAAWMRYQQLKDQRRDADDSLREKETKRKSEAEAQRAKRLQERHAVFAREVPGWSPEVAKSVSEYAISEGITNEELVELTDARFVRILKKAMLADKLEKQQRAALKAQKTEANPVPTVRTAGNTGAGQLRDDLSDAEWLRRREKQIEQRRK